MLESHRCDTTRVRRRSEVSSARAELLLGAETPTRNWSTWIAAVLRLRMVSGDAGGVHGHVDHLDGGTWARREPASSQNGDVDDSRSQRGER